MELPRGEDIYVVGMTGNLFLPVRRGQVKSGSGGGGGGVFSGLTCEKQSQRTSQRCSSHTSLIFLFEAPSVCCVYAQQEALQPANTALGLEA